MTATTNQPATAAITATQAGPTSQGGNYGLLASSSTLDKTSNEFMELKKQVTQSLRVNGTLTKLRAELKFSILQLLNSSSASPATTKKTSTTDVTVEEVQTTFKKSSEGALIISMVVEWMQWLGLDRTLQMLQTELDLPINSGASALNSRQEIESKLQLRSHSQGSNSQKRNSLLGMLLSKHLDMSSTSFDIPNIANQQQPQPHQQGSPEKQKVPTSLSSVTPASVDTDTTPIANIKSEPLQKSTTKLDTATQPINEAGNDSLLNSDKHHAVTGINVPKSISKDDDFDDIPEHLPQFIPQSAQARSDPLKNNTSTLDDEAIINTSPPPHLNFENNQQQPVNYADDFEQTSRTTVDDADEEKSDDWSVDGDGGDGVGGFDYTEIVD